MLTLLLTLTQVAIHIWVDFDFEEEESGGPILRTFRPSDKYFTSHVAADQYESLVFLVS